MAAQAFKRLVRFIPRSNTSRPLIGQPRDDSIDVGLALYKGKEVVVDVFSGSSVLSPGKATGSTAVIDLVLSPLAAEEVGTIRCIGLNYKQHAEEVGMDLPTVPTLFLKPSTALASPWPQPVILPKLTQKDDCGDYESELAVVIGKAAKNVSEADALDYILGYTACNDVSSRSSQLSQSPTLVSPALIPDASKLKIRGLKNDQVLQECGTDIPKLISFLSQDTTLPAGTIIITGTPAGVGMSRKPRVTLKDGDVFAVEILPHIGTLINKFEKASPSSQL